MNEAVIDIEAEAFLDEKMETPVTMRVVNAATGVEVVTLDMILESGVDIHNSNSPQVSHLVVQRGKNEQGTMSGIMYMMILNADIRIVR